MSDINNMNLETASFALDCVEKVIGEDFAENNKVWVNNIIDWSVQNRRIKSLFKANKYSQIEYIKLIGSFNSNKYRMISKEMIILFGWIKRFADGMIEKKKDGSKDD